MPVALPIDNTATTIAPTSAKTLSKGPEGAGTCPPAAWSNNPAAPARHGTRSQALVAG